MPVRVHEKLFGPAMRKYRARNSRSCGQTILLYNDNTTHYPMITCWPPLRHFNILAFIYKKYIY